MYPPELVKPMREDLTKVGFTELYNAEDVNNTLSKPGTTLVVVNSVCGCAAANARPAAVMSLQNEKKPDQIVTVFAGVDKEAKVIVLLLETDQKSTLRKGILIKTL